MALRHQKLATQREQVKYRYDAFLSYAHEDKPTVAWLHKLLTTFWVPWKRRRSVFMDQESLPAGGGLSANLKDALKETRFLIVCCSRNSAESYWVHLEITEFLNSHPAENVLACVVGDRATEASFSVPPMIDCIENELLKDETFKPDLRGKPENLKGQVLKAANKEALSLLAPLVNLPSKDSLLDRRKKNLIVGSVLVFVIVMSTIGWKIWDDRDESQINKVLSQSSDLVRAAANGFYPTDRVIPWLQTMVISGRSDEALEVARKIENPSFRSQAMASIVEPLAKAGMADEARQAANEAFETDRQYSSPEQMASIVEPLAKAGKTNEARQVANEALEEARHKYAGDRFQAMVSIVEPLTKAGMMDEAGQAAFDALYVAHQTENADDRSRLMVSAIESLATASMVNEAITVARKIENADDRSKAMASIVKPLVKAGKTDEARLAANEALEAARQIKEEEFRFIAMTDIAELLAKIGKTNEERQAVIEAFEAARQFGPEYTRSMAIAGIVGPLAKIGKTDEALEAARQIKDAVFHFKAMARIVEPLAKAGKTDEALLAANEVLEAARQIENADDRFQAMARIIEPLAKAGKTDEARQAVIETLNAARQIAKAPQFDPQFGNAQARSRLIASAIEPLAKAGKADEALEAARLIEDAGFRSQAMVIVAEVMIKNRQGVRAKSVLDEAERAAQQSTHDETKSAILADIAKGLAKLHLYKLAREMANLCTSSSDKLAAYTAILREYHIRHHPDQAKLFEEEKPE